MSKTFTVYGRAFQVVAEFEQGEAGMKQANEYMEEHRDTGLLHEGGGRLIIARLDDKGVPVKAVAA